MRAWLRTRLGGRVAAVGLVVAPVAAATGEPPTVQDVIVSPSSVGAVEFPHTFHIEDLEIACTECHHETHAATLYTPHDDYLEDFWIDCRICHRGDGDAGLASKNCQHCHPVTPADSADETLSAKVVIHERCWTCHEIGTGQEASRGCPTCHTGPRQLP